MNRRALKNFEFGFGWRSGSLRAMTDRVVTGFLAAEVGRDSTYDP
jgi:hypothetical protein